MKCPICNQEYNKIWKILSHIKKLSKQDDKHQSLFINWVNEARELYFNKPNNNNRFWILTELKEKNNFLGYLSYPRLLKNILKEEDQETIEYIRRNRISQGMKNHIRTEEHCKSLSLTTKRAWSEGKLGNESYRKSYLAGIAKRNLYGQNNPMYGRQAPKGSGVGKGGFREDIGIYVRSRWEANFVRILNHLNIEYEYEPKFFTITISDRVLNYTPDFYIPTKDLYFEIKGHALSFNNWQCECSNCTKNKVAIKKLKNKININLVGHRYYYKLIDRYKHQINFE